MPSYVYFDDTEWDDSTDVTPADIAACEDPDKLKAWSEAFEETVDSVTAQIEARRISGTADAEWLVRASKAHAFAGMGMSKVRRRLKQIGHDPNPLGTRLNEANQKLAIARANAAHGAAFIGAARVVLSDEQFTAIQDAALASLSEAAPAAA